MDYSCWSERELIEELERRDRGQYQDHTIRTLLDAGFREYVHKPTGFKGWSKQDLCTLDDCKDWYLD